MWSVNNRYHTQRWGNYYDSTSNPNTTTRHSFAWCHTMLPSTGRLLPRLCTALENAVHVDVHRTRPHMPSALDASCAHRRQHICIMHIYASRAMCIRQRHHDMPTAVSWISTCVKHVSIAISHTQDAPSTA